MEKSKYTTNAQVHKLKSERFDSPLFLTGGNLDIVLPFDCQFCTCSVTTLDDVDEDAHDIININE